MNRKSGIWSGGVVEWWSGGVVEWWSGGMVEWWSGGVLEIFHSSSTPVLQYSTTPIDLISVLFTLHLQILQMAPNNRDTGSFLPFRHVAFAL